MEHAGRAGLLILSGATSRQIEAEATTATAARVNLDGRPSRRRICPNPRFIMDRTGNAWSL